LHWLPVEERVLFKTAIMTFRCLNNTAPPYLSSHVKLYEPKRNLRSIHSRTIVAPSFKLGKYGGRSFTCASPSVWNVLPLSVRSETDRQQFKLKLKTHLFAIAYVWWPQPKHCDPNVSVIRSLSLYNALYKLNNTIQYNKSKVKSLKVLVSGYTLIDSFKFLKEIWPFFKNIIILLATDLHLRFKLN
jgi:hypothetical protein